LLLRISAAHAGLCNRFEEIMSDQAAAPAPVFDMPGAGATFEARGGWVLNRLMAEFALTQKQASGAVGNLGGESGLQAVQERRPISGRGGWGWCQWTASRRIAFEHWCADHDLDQASDEANYGFLVEELRTTQKHVIEQLKKTTTVEAAVYTFEAIFERPADLQSGLAARIRFAERALAGAVGIAPAPAPEPAAPSEPAGSTADQLNEQELVRLLGHSIAEHQADLAAPMPVPASTPPAKPPSRPVHTAIASAGLAAATVVSAVWGLQEFGISVPDNVQNAWMVIVTAIGAGLLHWQPSLAAVVPPSPPPTEERKS
jgi:hypothetical protein